MSGRIHDALEAGREAVRRHDWAEARRLLTRADAAGKLDGEGLRQLGKVMEWSGDVAATLDAFERSYAAFVAASDRRSAAKVALMLRHVCANMLRDTAAARGWLQAHSICSKTKRNVSSSDICGEPRAAPFSSTGARTKGSPCSRTRSILVGGSAARTSSR